MSERCLLNIMTPPAVANCCSKERYHVGARVNGKWVVVHQFSTLMQAHRAAQKFKRCKGVSRILMMLDDHPITAWDFGKGPMQNKWYRTFYTEKIRQMKRANESRTAATR